MLQRVNLRVHYRRVVERRNMPDEEDAGGDEPRDTGMDEHAHHREAARARLLNGG